MVRLIAAGALLWLVTTVQAQLTVDQVLREPSTLINTSVSVKGIVSAVEANPDQLSNWNYTVKLTSSDDKVLPVRIYMRHQEDLPEIGKVWQVSGIVRWDEGQVFLEANNEFNVLLLALVGLAVLAAVLIFAIVRSARQRPTMTGQTAANVVGDGGGSTSGGPVFSQSGIQAPCAVCGRMIPATDNFCDFCGADQRAQVVTVAPKVPASLADSDSTKLDSGTADPTTLDTLVGNLYVKQGNLKGKFFPIGGKPITIGRDPACTLTLSGDNVSRVHAEVYIESGQIWIKDKESTNGTSVNGQRVEKHILSQGDEIQIGSNTLVFEKR